MPLLKDFSLSSDQWHPEQIAANKPAGINNNITRFCVFDANYRQVYAFANCKAYLVDCLAAMANNEKKSGKHNDAELLYDDVCKNRIRIGIARSKQRVINAVDFLNQIEEEYGLKLTTAKRIVDHAHITNINENVYVAVIDGDKRWALSPINISLYSSLLRIGTFATDLEIKKKWRDIIKMCILQTGSFGAGLADSTYLSKAFSSGLLEALLKTKLVGPFNLNPASNFPKFAAPLKFMPYHDIGIDSYCNNDNNYTKLPPNLRAQWDKFAKKFGLR